MFRAYVQWCFGALAGCGVSLPTPDGRIAGFDSFSEYWGVSRNLPTHAESRLVERMLAPGRVAVDIGANIGQFTLLMSSSGATVYSFEPFPETFARLRENIRQNGRQDLVYCHSAAVCDSIGTVRMQRTTSAATHRIGRSTDGIPVHSTTLDSFCKVRGISSIDLLKIDVEGAEPLVLRGAGKMLSEHAIECLLIEICPGNLELLGFSTDDIVDALAAHGYSLHRLAEDGLAAERLSNASLEKITLENVLAIRI